MDRAETITRGREAVSPYLGVATTVHVQPLDADGARALVIPAFAMVAAEVDPVLRKMSAQGWRVGGLSSHTAAETPQLYWSHMWKVGPPEPLAREVRLGLGLCDMKYVPKSSAG